MEEQAYYLNVLKKVIRVTEEGCLETPEEVIKLISDELENAENQAVEQR